MEGINGNPYLYFLEPHFHLGTSLNKHLILVLKYYSLVIFLMRHGNYLGSFRFMNFEHLFKIIIKKRINVIPPGVC